MSKLIHPDYKIKF